MNDPPFELPFIIVATTFAQCHCRDVFPLPVERPLSGQVIGSSGQKPRLFQVSLPVRGLPPFLAGAHFQPPLAVRKAPLRASSRRLSKQALRRSVALHHFFNGPFPYMPSQRREPSCLRRFTNLRWALQEDFRFKQGLKKNMTPG